jgi:hypothetical protein
MFNTVTLVSDNEIVTKLKFLYQLGPEGLEKLDQMKMLASSGEILDGIINIILNLNDSQKVYQLCEMLNDVLKFIIERESTSEDIILALAICGGHIESKDTENVNWYHVLVNHIDIFGKNNIRKQNIKKILEKIPEFNDKQYYFLRGMLHGTKYKKLIKRE